MKYNPMKMVEKSHLHVLFDNSPDHIRTHVLSLIHIYIDQEPLFTDRGNYRHLCNIFTSIAFCAVYEYNGQTRRQSVTAVRNAMYAQLALTLPKIRMLSRLPFFIPLLRQFIPLLQNRIFGAGWEVTFPARGKQAFSLTTHQCLYQQFFRRYQVPELTPVFCHADDILYGDLPGADFGYTYQIGCGGPYCDYTFRRKESALTEHHDLTE